MIISKSDNLKVLKNICDGDWRGIQEKLKKNYCLMSKCFIKCSWVKIKQWSNSVLEF